MKTIAIVLVTIGHCSTGIIQEVIYSFHMPLFFILSGFFLHPYFDKPVSYISKRMNSLILPAIVVGIIVFIIRFFNEEKLDINLWLENHSAGYIATYVPWFLVSLFIASTIIIVCKSWIKSDIMATIVLSIVSICFPSNVLYVNAFIPFIWIGYILKKYLWTIIKRNISLIIAVSIAIFIGCYLTLWDKEFLCYSFNSIIVSFSNGFMIVPPAFKGVIIRLITGVAGSVFIIGISMSLTKYSIAIKQSYIGRNTLGIYVLQFILLQLPVVKYAISSMNEIFAIVIGLSSTILLNAIVEHIRKYDSIAILLLGERVKIAR